ncbi:MAG TPA: prepilin-type N-terminal cleavage/methylation domain-containing protein [Kiritimatiellia bacterium]|nr:prepilin-type N-terminal cleavage/methylation domain-containing protein [Kiritimatiellia bacterium]
MAFVKFHPRSPRAGGFTLIELLVSMVVLISMVMMMARLFTESTNAWALGTKRVNAAAEGRAVMDFIVRELTQAIADDVVTFRMNSENALYGVDAFGADSDELIFAAMVRPGHSAYKRNVNQFAYFIAPMVDEENRVMPNRYRLVRTRRTTSIYESQANREVHSAYRNPNWWREMGAVQAAYGTPAPSGVQFGNMPNLETIAENVAAFEVWAWSERQGNYSWNFDSRDEDNQLPVWLDVYLEMLGEDEAQRAALLWAANQQEAKEYISRNAQRFTARVYFPNRPRALAFR